MSLELVQRVRAKYPPWEDPITHEFCPLGIANAWAITNEVVLALGEDWGLVSKPSGNNHNGYSVDVIMRRDGTAVDILGDSEGAGVPKWDEIEPIDPARWRFPVGTAIPPPPPTPTPVDLAAVMTAIADLRGVVVSLAAGEAEIANRLSLLAAQVAALPPPVVFPPYSGRISLWGTTTMKPEVKP